MSNSVVLVFSGPSGAGKSTLLNMLFQNFPNKFAFSVSHTTRPIRLGEVDGKDYHFVSMAQMMQDISEGKFLEHAEFAGNMYGTSRAAVKQVMDSGRICVLDVEMEGVKSIHAVRPALNAQFILIRPLSLDSLESRLRGRGTETEETLQRRIARAKLDLDFADCEVGQKLFHKVIINEQLDEAYKELEDTVRPLLSLS
ncbi:unnamed protein product [Dicrocoelium dendriticum]|nr:unnamed protein product [Dicrocoelium dendriticum]